MFSGACVSHSVTGGLPLEGAVCIQEAFASGGGLGRPPAPSTTGYGQQVRGKHPTGMHSCLTPNFTRYFTYRFTWIFTCSFMG